MVRRSVSVPLPEEAIRALRHMAAGELREPREQASWLLQDALRKAGALTEAPPERTAAAAQ
jgi:hypothetical protein